MSSQGSHGFQLGAEEFAANCSCCTQQTGAEQDEGGWFRNRRADIGEGEGAYTPETGGADELTEVVTWSDDRAGRKEAEDIVLGAIGSLEAEAIGIEKTAAGKKEVISAFKVREAGDGAASHEAGDGIDGPDAAGEGCGKRAAAGHGEAAKGGSRTGEGPFEGVCMS